MKIILAPNSSRPFVCEVGCFRPFVDEQAQLCYGFNCPFGLSGAALQDLLEGVLSDLHSKRLINSWATGYYPDCPRGVWLWLNDNRDISFE